MCRLFPAFSTPLVSKVTFEESRIQCATCAALGLGIAVDDAGAAQSIKAFGRWAWFAFGDTLQDLGQIWVLCK